jgi:GTP-binding protein
MDLPEVKKRWPSVARALRKKGVAEPLAISAVTGDGVTALLRRAADTLAALPPAQPMIEIAPMAPLMRAEARSFTIEKDANGIWSVQGQHIERIVAMTRWEYYDAVMRFQRILEALGITEALRKRDVKPGDTVRIGGKELEWSD